jgi:hypothetical protein
VLKKQDKKPYLNIKKLTKSNKTKNLRNYGNIRKKAMNFAYGMGSCYCRSSFKITHLN